MQKLESLIKTHPKKTLVAIKLAPLLPAPGLMMVGATRMSFDEFSGTAFVITLPKAIFFMALGFYFGRAYDRIAATLQNGEYFIVVALIAVVAAFYLYKMFAARLSTRLETI
jgi:membrane protein DedA with SNARE-associated domain